ncbi:MAG TPA: MFS transporter [Negativicutes bacterium]|jgi:MFS family permease
MPKKVVVYAEYLPADLPFHGMSGRFHLIDSLLEVVFAGITMQITERSLNMRNFSVSEVMDSLGVNKFTWFILVFLGMAMVFDGYDFMIVSYTMPQLAAEWGLSKALTGSLSSWSAIGLVIGGALAGNISDKVGRRKTLTFAIALYSLLTIPIYFVQSFEAFAFFRVLAGLGLGACIPLICTIFSESTPTNRRAFFITFGMAWLVAGWVLAGVIATWLVPLFGWRICYLVGGVPFIYSIFLYFKMPESVYWLASKGRKAEAVKGLQYIEKLATGKCTDWDAAALVVPAPPKVVGPKALFTKDYRMITAGLWITYFCVCFISYGIYAWIPSLMLEKGFTLTSAYSLAIAQSAAGALASVITGFVAEKIGRRWNLIVAFVYTAAAIGAVAFVGNTFSTVLAAVIFMGFGLSYAGSAITPVMAEAYPTEFRNTGVAWAQAFGRIAQIISPVVTGLVLAMGLGIAMSFLLFIIFALLGAVATIVFVRKETKGKSLDQLATEQ